MHRISNGCNYSQSRGRAEPAGVNRGFDIRNTEARGEFLSVSVLYSSQVQLVDLWTAALGLERPGSVQRYSSGRVCSQRVGFRSHRAGGILKSCL